MLMLEWILQYINWLCMSYIVLQMLGLFGLFLSFYELFGIYDHFVCNYWVSLVLYWSNILHPYISDIMDYRIA